LGEPGIHRIDPGSYAGFSDVYLLTAAYQTDDGSPIFMPIHAGDQELRLRLGEIRTSLLASHEIRGLLQGPGPLGLVEYGDVLRWRSRIDQDIVAEMMDILDERLDGLGDLALSGTKTPV
jgi:hypothetical protein